MTGFQLHEDKNFHYETLRSLGTVRYFGSDIKEQLDLMPKIKVNDFDSWYDAWSGLAKTVLSTIDENNLQQYNAATIRNVYFRASHYYFVSEFFLHLNWDDPRSLDAFAKWRKYFEIANAHLEIPGIFFKVSASFGEIPGYLFRTPKASASNPRPTIILNGGYDSNMEECLHDFGFDLLERGYNCIIFDGPGQPAFLRDQHVGFIYDWERVITPIVDYLHAHKEHSFVDTSNIGLLGMSLGGYLAARAAAFEPRLSAVILLDGVWSFMDCILNAFPELKAPWEAGDEAALNETFAKNGLKTADSNRRWIHDHLKLAMQEKNAFVAFEEVAKMDLENGVAQKIKMPIFVGDAAEDIFFEGQPPKVAAAIGGNATLFEFTAKYAAAAHSASGALLYQNQMVWEWFAKVTGDKQ
ncbi:hypothetical protein AMS68_003809 [Peltaster fructicola]|uniref:AB hydrolase-1 domain-containing protein n=1 Tax=Peltaster fructicola TaxID=286661 RepID=A0A6H0XU54_9PEZI|nr:hypothetical protein AMS68_003809 [Peltaster fructicola]